MIITTLKINILTYSSLLYKPYSDSPADQLRPFFSEIKSRILHFTAFGPHMSSFSSNLGQSLSLFPSLLPFSFVVVAAAMTEGCTGWGCCWLSIAHADRNMTMPI